MANGRLEFCILTPEIPGGACKYHILTHGNYSYFLRSVRRAFSSFWALILSSSSFSCWWRFCSDSRRLASWFSSSESRAPVSSEVSRNSFRACDCCFWNSLMDLISPLRKASRSAAVVNRPRRPCLAYRVSDRALAISRLQETQSIRIGEEKTD